jgi:hypothetical protein
VNTIFSKKQSHLKLEQTDGKKKMIVCMYQNKTKNRPKRLTVQIDCCTTRQVRPTNDY